jgi:drug/metabolite transporter (DMT)-like permease
MNTTAMIKIDHRKIASDVATVAATVGGAIAILVNVAPAVHIPAGATAALVSVSGIVAGIAAEARRIARTKKAATAALLEEVAKKAPAKKAPAKKAVPAKRAAGK